MVAYQQLLTEYNNGLLLRSGFSERQERVILTPIRWQTLEVFNPGISFAAIIFPGLLVMLLQHLLLIAACIRVNMAMKSMYGGKALFATSLGGDDSIVADLVVPIDCAVCIVAVWAELPPDGKHYRNPTADFPVPAGSAGARQTDD